MIKNWDELLSKDEIDIVTDIFLNSKFTRNSKYYNVFIKIKNNFEFKNLSYDEIKYLFLNNITDIAKCKFSNDKAHFISHKKTYLNVSKKYFEFIKNDENIKCKYFTWENLFSKGLTLEDAKIKKRDKFYNLIRLYFSAIENLNEENFTNFLLSKDFNEKKIEYLYSMVNTNNIVTIDVFVTEFVQIIHCKNTSIEYWVSRGWNNEEVLQKRKWFFEASNRSIQKKRSESIEYDINYILQKRKCRSIGHLKLMKEKQSSFEKDLINLLSINHKCLKYFTPCINEDLRVKFNKMNFIHDIYIDDKYIIEYNGSYWHKDYTCIDKFTKEDYMFEIKKAYNCLKEVKRNNNPNYIVIWENDVSSVEDAKLLIEKFISLNTSGEFFSSRSLDISLFNEYIKQVEKKKKEILLFKDLALRISNESHCESKKVAAIAVKNGRMIAMGINGTPKNQINCNDYFTFLYKEKKIKCSYDEWIKTTEWRELHSEWSEKNEIHAEQSLVGQSAKEGICLNDIEIYVTLKPCVHCTKLLLALHPKKIYYINDYDKSSKVSEFILNSAGIVLEKI